MSKALLSDRLIREAHRQHETGIKLVVLGRHYGVRGAYLGRRMRGLGLETHNFQDKRERARVMGWPVGEEFNERSASGGVVRNRRGAGCAGGDSCRGDLPDAWRETDGQGSGLGAGLHPTSAAILRFIIAYKRWYTGNSPARRQIAEAVGRGLSVVHYQLARLERGGRITTLHDDARSIAIPGATWTPPEWFLTSGSQELEELPPLTRSVCEFIIRHMVNRVGASPSYREIMEGTGVLSTSLVAHHIKLLEAAGLVRRPMRGQARMIVIPGARWELGEVERWTGAAEISEQ